MNDAAARREARRRRILENADNRLKRITGMNSTDEASEKPIIKSISRPKLYSHSGNTEEECIMLQSELLNSVNQVNEESNDEKFVTQESNEVKNSHRYSMIIFLAITIRYANFIADTSVELLGLNLSFLHIEMIFIPFLCYKIAEYSCFNIPDVNNSTFNMLLLLNKMDPGKFKMQMRIVNGVLAVFGDMSVYFFFFVMFDVIFKYMGV